MKTKLQSIFCLMLLMVSICSCNSYDQKKADAFVDKLRTDQKLTQEEFSEALDIAILGAEEIVSEYSKLSQTSSSYMLDKAVLDSKMSTPEGKDKQLAIYFIDARLTKLQNDLNFRNQEKLKTLNELVKKVKKYRGVEEDEASDETPVVVDCDESTDEEVSTESFEAHAFVDLGLSVYWAKYNVGKTKNSDGTLYTYSTENDVAASQWGIDKDVASTEWGDSWRIPYVKEIKELIENCTQEYIDENGRKTSKDGAKVIRFTSKKNGASIDFPIMNSYYATYVPDQFNDEAYTYDFIKNDFSEECENPVLVRPVRVK